MSHLKLFLSSASRKAWVSGFIGALLSPLITLLQDSSQVVTLRTLVLAILSGVVASAVVYATNNDPVVIDYNDPKLVEGDDPGSHAVDRDVLAPDPDRGPAAPGGGSAG